jgi:hypothetical protein
VPSALPFAIQVPPRECAVPGSGRRDRRFYGRHPVPPRASAPVWPGSQVTTSQRRPRGRRRAGAAAWFECRTAQIVPAGDHDVVLADVLESREGDPGAGSLVHLRRRVRGLR